MKRAWVLAVGLLLIALLTVPMISALADSVITASSNGGADTSLKNPAVRRRRRRRCCRESARRSECGRVRGRSVYQDEAEHAAAQPIQPRLAQGRQHRWNPAPRHPAEAPIHQRLGGIEARRLLAAGREAQL